MRQLQDRPDADSGSDHSHAFGDDLSRRDELQVRGASRIRRETSPELLERIATLPEVKPSVIFTDGPIDFWQIIRGCCVLSNGSDAIAIFEETEPRVWEGHILFAPTHRGREAEATAREMVAWLMPKYADSIWGAILNANRAARLFMRRIGFTPIAGEDVELFYLKRAE